MLAPGAVIECDCGPLSDQLLKRYCVPVPDCGEVVEMACYDPTIQLNVCWFT